MELSIYSFDRICRACLCSSDNMKSLFTKLEGDNQSLMDLFILAAKLDARDHDGLPKQVCGDCELFLYKSEEFRKICLHSENELNKVIISGPTRSTITENYTNDDKNILYIDKLAEFGLDKKDFGDISVTFGPVSNTHTLIDIPTRSASADLVSPTRNTDTHDVKEEYYENDQDFHDFDETEPIIEYKQSSKQVKSTDTPSKKPKSQKGAKSKELHVTYKSLIQFEDHLETINIENKEKELTYQCSLCFRRCKTKKTLSKHMKLHERTDNIKYTCDKCKREFKYKSFLENHVISVHMHNNDYNCNICKEKFKRKESLEIHLDTHKDKKHVCSICSKAFIMLCTLKDHMRKHTGEKPFLCCTCGKGFSQKTNLAQHTRRHLGVKPYKCSICTKSFVSKGELDAHGRKHSGAHPFVCDDCGCGFTTSSALVKHRRTHTGERPYACDLCPMRFAASGTLKNHRRTHTGERPFQCSLCTKAFVQRTDLISHIRCHTGERPYACRVCGQAFRKQAALKAHAKVHKDAVCL